MPNRDDSVQAAFLAVQDYLHGRIGLLRGPAEVPGGRFRGLGACAKVVRKGFGLYWLADGGGRGCLEVASPDLPGGRVVVASR
jgi:hypothetical protein